jgi:hypothetical protein
MYETAKDIKGKKQTEKKLQELQRNLARLERRKKDLKNELPPRPLPQPQFIQVSENRSVNDIQTLLAKALLPPKELFLKVLLLLLLKLLFLNFFFSIFFVIIFVIIFVINFIKIM